MEFNEYVSEYLLIFSEERKLMQTSGDLVDALRLNKSLCFENKSDDNVIIGFKEKKFKIDVKKIKSKNEKYRSYLITINNIDNLTEIKEKLLLRDLNKEIIDTIKELQHSQLNTLRDDLLTEFSIEGYKHIHEVENKMRKLITIFMSTRVGLEWIKYNIPQEVTDSIKKKESINETQSINTFLSETDFIQLSKFLFDKYSTIKINDVHRILNTTKKSINIDKLMDFVPKSNWQRYFLPEISPDQNDLKQTDKKEERLIDDWENLYDLRNKVAHNRFISYEELRKIIDKKNKIITVINDAFNAMENIEITKEQTNEIGNEIKATIQEKSIEKEINVENLNIESDNKTSNQKEDKVIEDSRKTISKLTRYIYMNISDSFKKELRKYRNNLNSALESYKLEPNGLTTRTMLELQLSRAKEYIRTLNQFI